MRFSVIFLHIFLVLAVFANESVKKIDYIRSVENDALCIIKDAYNIENADWNEFLQKITQVRAQAKDLFSTANPAVKHNPNISQEKLQIIYDIFKEYNINPQSIHLECDSNKTLEKTNTLAHAGITLMTMTAFGYHWVENPKIMLSESLLLTKNTEEFKAIVYHEVGHLLEIHGAIKILVEKVVEGREHGKIQKSAIHNLQRTQEFIADQYCASKNSTVLLILEKYLKPKKNSKLSPYDSADWYPNVSTRFESFVQMKNAVYGNAINQQLL